LAHQIHKVDLQVELKEAIVNQLPRHSIIEKQSAIFLLPSMSARASLIWRRGARSLNRFEKPATVQQIRLEDACHLIGELRSIIRR